MKLQKGQKIVVYYADESVGEYESFEEAEKDIEENVIGSNFNNAVDSIRVLDKDENEVSVLGCKWAVKDSQVIKTLVNQNK